MAYGVGALSHTIMRVMCHVYCALIDLAFFFLDPAFDVYRLLLGIRIVAIIDRGLSSANTE